MAIHNVETPDGQIIKVEAPDGASQDEIISFAQQNYKPKEIAAPVKEERSWFRAATDPFAGLISGAGSFLQTPGKLQELALGQVSPEALAAIKGQTGTGLQGAGKKVQDFGESLISPQYKQFEQQAAAKSEKAGEEAGGGIKGVAAELYTVLKEVTMNPEMFPTFIGKQLPQMVGPLAAGKGLQVGTKLLFKEIGEKALTSIGVGGAISAGAIMQGTDVGYDAFEDTFRKLIDKGVPENRAYEQALEVGKDAFLGAAAISVATQMLPGGRSLERSVLAGKPVKPSGLLRPTLGESGTEGLEEGGGKVAANLAQQQVLPETDILKGSGTQAGFGVAGGFGAGITSGLISRGRAPSATKESAFLGQEPPTRNEADITAGQSPELTALLQPALAEGEQAPSANIPAPTTATPTAEGTPVDTRGFPAPPTDLPAGVLPAGSRTTPEPEPDTSKKYPAIERDVEGATLPNVEFGTPGGVHNAIAQRLRATADSLGITPLIYNKLQQGKSAKQITNDVKAKLTFLPESGRANFVEQVLKTLGPRQTQTTPQTTSVGTSETEQQPGTLQGPVLRKVNIGESPTDMVNQVAQTMRREADQKGLTAYIADQSAKGRSAKQIANSYGFAPKLEFLPPEQRHNYVRQVQATLGYGPIAQRWGVNVNQPTIPSRGRKSTKASSQPTGTTTTEPTVVDESGMAGVNNPPADTTTGTPTEPPTLTETPPTYNKEDDKFLKVEDVSTSGKHEETNNPAIMDSAKTYEIKNAFDETDQFKLARLEDGSVILFYTDKDRNIDSHSLKVNKDFAEKRTDDELIKFLFKDHAYRSHKEVTPETTPRDVISDLDLNPPETKVDIDSVAPPVDPSPTAPVTVTPPSPRAVYMALVEGINGSANIKDPALRDLLVEKKLVNKDGITEAGFSFKKVFDGKIFDKELGFERDATPKDANDLFSDVFGGRDGKFEVGDSVRIGNTLGTVIGVSENYVQFRPVNATNKKASQKVPVYAVEFVSRPDTSSKSSASKRVQKGSFEFNKDEVLENLGQNMYGSALANVSVKELLQNAFDGVKSAIYNGIDKGKYKVGKIDIVVNHNDRTVTVHDDSIGMSPDILQKAFFTVGGSDKQNLPPELRSGGFGLAKVGFMVSTESMKVVTISDGVQSTVDASSRDIRASNFDIVIEDAPKNKHGTTVTVKIPETFKDKKGEDQHIWFPYSADSVDILNKPLLGDVEVTFTIKTYADSEGTKVTVPIGVNTDFKKTPKLTTATFSWGTADIYLGVERKQEAYYAKHRVLSSGVYQFDANFKLNDKEKIPFDVIVDVKPNVKASDIDYPFENSRERFKSRIDADIKSLQGFLQQIVRADDAKNLQEGFKNIVSMPRIDPDNVTNNDKDELKFAFKNKGTSTSGTNTTYTAPKNIVIGEGTVKTSDGKVIVKENVKESTFKVDKEAAKTTDFLIDIKQDPKLPILHNNLNVDLIEVGEKAGGDPKLFFAELGSIFVEMKEELANSGMWGYDQLSPNNLFFAGVSLDKGYGGMIIKVPYKSLFLNPFYDFGQRSIFGTRSVILTTMMHEIAHIADMDHGVGHNGEQIKVANYLEDTGLMDYYRDAILTTLQKHWSAYEAMKNEYDKSTTRNNAKSFEEGQNGAASRTTGGSASSTVNQPQTVPAGGGQGGSKNIPTPSATSATSPVNAGTTSQPAKGKRVGQHPPVSLLTNNPAYNPANQGPQAVAAAQVKSATQAETFFSKLARKYVNFRYPVRRLQNALELAKKDIWSGDDINVTSTLLSMAGAKGQNYYRGVLAAPIDALNSAIGEYADAAKLDTNKALENLHIVAEAKHEPERRLIKWLLTVPLSTAKNLMQNGNPTSAADRRQAIVDTLNRNKLTTAQVKSLRAELDKLVANYQDALGYSPRRESKFGGITGPMDTNLNANIYRVSSLDAADISRIMGEYNANPHKAKMDKALTLVKDIAARTLALNQLSNYVSDPVINRVEFYGWNNYVPLKGYDAVSPFDEELDFINGKRMSRELQEQNHSFDGRETPSHNPIMQTVIEAVKSAGRAGRGSDTTLSIKNLVLQGHIPGTVSDPIPFENRDEEIADAAKKNAVFHFNKDGSVEVIRINDLTMLEAIRRTYEDSNWAISMLNKITSTIGKGHTRYNYTFAPFNFARDAITNTYAISSDFGPIEGAKIISMIAARTIGNTPTAVKVAYMWENNDIAGLKALSGTNGFASSMVEYISNGGMQSFTQSMTIGNKIKELDKLLKRGGIAKTKAEVSKVLDIYNNMFELVSRTATYEVIKSRFVNKDKMSNDEAAKRAAAYVKELANFEQFGENSRGIAAWFMFFRSSATGAARAIEATIPAFTPTSVAVNRLPQSVKSDPTAVAEFKRNYNKKRMYSAITTAGAFGLGYYIYGLAAASAPDDEYGRNSVKTDNMDLWNRNARFPIPKEITTKLGIQKDVVFQIPWGFGQGAFASAGAQIAAANAGQISTAHALKNVFTQIAFDSYVPIPMSKMDVTKNPLAYTLDSITPNFARPLLEFALNKNGLGNDINPNQQGKFGSAYRGAEYIPDIYKDAARWFADTTGETEITANSLYFFANNYFDGVAKIIEGTYGLINPDKSKLPFDPRKDTLIFGSFFGNKASVDNREFAELREQMDSFTRKTNMFLTNPQKALDYAPNKPIIDMWNRDLNGTLKQLQERAKNIELDTSLNRAQRNELMQGNKQMQIVLKQVLLDKYKAMGIYKPQ